MLQTFSQSRWIVILGLALAVAAGVGACGSNGGNTSSGTPTGTSGGSTQSTSGSPGGAGGMGGDIGLGGNLTVGSTGGAGQEVLDVQPSAPQTITVAAGQAMPTVTYTATLNGSSTNVSWSVDRGDLATVPAGPSSTAIVSPTGTTGGVVNVLAIQNNKTISRQILIKLTAGPQNGGDPANPAEQAQIPGGVGALTQGGGVGGVGGEGLGPAFMGFPTTVMPPAMGLKFLYPYDKTVWPRGMLAPLLMWDWAPGDADAIQISLATTSGSFSWTGTFGRPALLGMGGAPPNFIRHPIPQDVWDMATNTAGGPTQSGMPDNLTLSLTVAKGGMAYGPITETWIVAPARLAGTVYYNSYGTQLVHNSVQGSYPNQTGPQFGAAVLAIKSGDTGPSVVAGTTSGFDGSGCRVCHVVAADGSRLIVQIGTHEVYTTTSTYDLKNGNAETDLVSYPNTFGWAGLYPDGTLALTNTADLAAGDSASQLYTFPPAASGATPLAVSGIPGNLQAGAPAFSPDGAHVAFEFLGGTIGSTSGNGTQLVALDFDKATLSFSNLEVLATMTGGKRAGFPSFFPTNDAVAFHYQIVNSNHRYNTWNGAEAQIWWSDLKTGTAASLDALNGLNPDGMTSYLPTGPNNHGNDSVLNYEPTVNPVVSGGYAWVVFTSRRLYGNLTTHDPWLSDPRNYDATQYANVTDKKLWVAAVDIGTIQNGMFMEGDVPGSDPSHPAFYLPAQELVAGNARGFWVLDPCKADGMSCMTGDQCCGGYCEPNGPNGSLVCGAPMGNMCSGLEDKCTTAADCCDPTALCINGFCAIGSMVQ